MGGRYRDLLLLLGLFAALLATGTHAYAAGVDTWCEREERRAHQQLQQGGTAETFAPMLRLAELARMREAPEAAAEWLRRASDLVQSLTTNVTGDAGLPLRMLAEVRYGEGCLLRSQGLFVEAETAFREARDAARLAGESGATLVARIAGAHASAMSVRGDLDQARQLCTWAVTHVSEHCGSNDVEVAWIDDMMGRTYATAGRHDLALPIYEHMLKVRKTALSPQHPDLAAAHNRLASVLFELKRTDEAIPHLEQARDIRARAFGPDHPLTRRSHENLSKAQATGDESP